MSYVDEVYERVVRENPSQPEFHQAVKEVFAILAPLAAEGESAIRAALRGPEAHTTFARLVK